MNITCVSVCVGAPTRGCVTVPILPKGGELITEESMAHY